jgi:DNA polymerase-3 subunit gamma/tau
MSYLVLARKWRPRTFAEMAGQEHVLRALINALDRDRVHHAFLFTGTRGVGKTTVARILAKCLNCEEGVTSEPCGKCDSCMEIDEGRFVDLIEVDAASRTKVDDTRELLDNVQYAPTRGRFKVYLIDEVHMLSKHSFNALLKTLEEPPPHVKFLLATTDPQKLPVTVLSRCLQFNLKRLPKSLIEQRLDQIAKDENIGSDARALALLAHAADGSMRDALSLLDQAISFGNGELKEDEVRTMLGSVGRQSVYRMLELLAQGDASALMAEIKKLDEQAPDYSSVLDELAAALKTIAVLQVVPDAADEDPQTLETLQAIAADMSPEDTQLYYQIALVGRRDLPMAPDPRSGFEMIALRMLAFRPPEKDQDQAQTPIATPAAKSTPVKKTKATKQKTSDKEVVEAKKVVAPVNGDWSGLIEVLPIKGAARQLASNCELLREEGKTFFLRLEERHVHLLTKQQQDNLRQALETHFGEPRKIRIETGSTQKETLAQKKQREADERMQAARDSIDSDPNVQALMQTFGATIQDESIEPLDSPKE